jgi:hypothetical protein
MAVDFTTACEISAYQQIRLKSIDAKRDALYISAINLK